MRQNRQNQMFLTFSCSSARMDILALAQHQEYSTKDCQKMSKALELAERNLSTQKRLAGDSYYDRNCRVAVILMESKVDPELVIVGLLQGLCDKVPEPVLQKEFGGEVVSLLQGVEDLKAIKIKNSKLEAEALRKILLTTLADVRVIVVKLASKLDNLQTITILPGSEQKRIAQEVLEVYAPLANRLGLEKIKVRLEDGALKVINPRKYQEIVNYLEESREDREKNVTTAIKLIEDIARGKVSILKIKGRPKHIYSIYKKMTERGVSLDEQYDLLGIRILAEDIKDCYMVLGLIHEKFEPIEGRLKDYIANPKQNGYQSIHTGVRLPNGKVLEIQIRTPTMNEFAEEGVAAHWRYKKIKSDEVFEKKIGWLRGVLDLQNQDENKEFLETVKVDLFGDTIYCYTPKGDVKELPKGATVLDFAYTVHQRIGDQCTGARVNGVFVPIKEEVKQGDIIEILTNKNQRPRRSWLKFVISARSRQKIRKSLKEHDKVPVLHYRKLTTSVGEDQGVLVESPTYPEAVCSLAKCCLPIPDEQIVGLVTKRRIISVHTKECRVLRKEEGKKCVQVLWKETFNQKIRFFVEAVERSGFLADVLHTIASAGFEVKEAKAKMIDVGKVQCSFLLVPRDLEQVKEMLKRVGKVKGILKMFFE